MQKLFSELATVEDRDEFFLEIKTMKTVSTHPNIVTLLGYCTLEDPLQIVMEYVGCGDLVSTDFIGKVVFLKMK